MRHLPFAKRKGTRASEARTQGMPEPPHHHTPSFNITAITVQTTIY